MFDGTAIRSQIGVVPLVTRFSLCVLIVLMRWLWVRKIKNSVRTELLFD